jgi:hypothetical protein
MKKQKGIPTVNTATIQLDQPIKRDGQTIAAISLRKPSAGELRGVSLLMLLQMDVGSIAEVLPRISDPMVHKAEVLQMDPADLLAVGVEVAGFLQQKGPTPQPSPSA